MVGPEMVFQFGASLSPKQTDTFFNISKLSVVKVVREKDGRQASNYLYFILQYKIT